MRVIIIEDDEKIRNYLVALISGSGKFDLKASFASEEEAENYFKENGYKGYRQSISSKHTINGWQINTKPIATKKYSFKLNHFYYLYSNS